VQPERCGLPTVVIERVMWDAGYRRHLSDLALSGGKEVSGIIIEP
jgi:hypothetical protein